MRLSAQRLYYVLIGIVCLSLVALLAGAYGANTLLKGRSTVVYDARLKVLTLEEEQRQLSKARADIDKYRSLADIAKHIVPQDKDQAQTVREIVNMAAQNDIKLGAINFPSSTLGDSKTPHSQLQPVANIKGVLSLTITVTSDGSSPATLTNFVNFLDALENNRRTALVSGISIVPNPLNPNRLSFTLTLTEYVKP